MKQPNALRLAEIMSQKAKGKTNELGDHWSPVWCEKAAAELRRQHEANQAMLEALKKCTEWMEALRSCGDAGYWDWREGREYMNGLAAIAKGEQA